MCTEYQQRATLDPKNNTRSSHMSFLHIHKIHRCSVQNSKVSADDTG